MSDNIWEMFLKIRVSAAGYLFPAAVIRSLLENVCWEDYSPSQQGFRSENSLFCGVREGRLRDFFYILLKYLRGIRGFQNTKNYLLRF